MRCSLKVTAKLMLKLLKVTVKKEGLVISNINPYGKTLAGMVGCYRRSPQRNAEKRTNP